MKSRPTPANLYTTRRIGLKHWLDHWLDPESKTLFSQGKYPTKLTYWDLPNCFLSGTYYGARVISALIPSKVFGISPVITPITCLRTISFTSLISTPFHLVLY